MGPIVNPATVGFLVGPAVGEKVGLVAVKKGPLTIVDPITFTKLIFALIKAPVSIPNQAYGSPEAELMKPTDKLYIG